MATPRKKGKEHLVDHDLTAQQKQFCREYIIDLNGTKAAIRAGYSSATAEVQASRLLTVPKIRALVDDYLSQRAARIEINAKNVLMELARVGFSDIRNLYGEDGKLKHPHEWPEDVARSIASIEVTDKWLGKGPNRIKVSEITKIKLWPKNQALETIGKMLGFQGLSDFSKGTDNQKAIEDKAQTKIEGKTRDEIQNLLESKLNRT